MAWSVGTQAFPRAVAHKHEPTQCICVYYSSPRCSRCCACVSERRRRDARHPRITIILNRSIILKGSIFLGLQHSKMTRGRGSGCESRGRGEAVGEAASQDLHSSMLYRAVPLAVRWVHRLVCAAHGLRSCSARSVAHTARRPGRRHLLRRSAAHASSCRV